MMASGHEIVKALSGTWNGRQGMCRCPAHLDEVPSLSVKETDGGRLLLFCHAGCSYSEIVAALKLRGFNLKLVPQTVFRHSTPPPEDPPEYDERDNGPDPKLLITARSLWKNGLGANNTIVEVYLRARGYVGPIPSELRFLPGWTSDDSGVPAAMLARVTDNQGRFVGCQKTPLLEDGSDRYRTEQFDRRSHGPVGDGAVRLFEPKDDELAVAEGVESALAVTQLSGGIPCWASLGVANLKNFSVPEGIKRLIIGADNDKAGQAVAWALRYRLVKQGIEALVVSPTDKGKDWADIMKEGIEDDERVKSRG